MIPQAILDACLSGGLNFGVFQCGGGPTAHFVVPASGGAPDSSGREALSVLGYACAGGTIMGDADAATGFTCNGADAKGWQFTGTYHVHSPMAANPANRNPSISEVRFGMGDMIPAIAANAPPTIPHCTDTSRMSSCPTFRFEVGFTPDSRESYTQLDPISRQPTMQTEHLTTGYVVDHGTLAGAFRTDSSADPTSSMSDDFHAPAEPGTVNVYIYTSDGRGGFDWTTRTVNVR
jgi:hypothetical protein